MYWGFGFNNPIEFVTYLHSKKFLNLAFIILERDVLLTETGMMSYTRLLHVDCKGWYSYNIMCTHNLIHY